MDFPASAGITEFLTCLEREGSYDLQAAGRPGDRNRDPGLCWAIGSTELSPGRPVAFGLLSQQADEPIINKT